MITFKIRDNGTYDAVEMYENNAFKNLVCVWKESQGYGIVDKNKGLHHYKAYGEAITAAKNLLRGDPYADANDRINKSIEANVIAAKYKMNLRAARFRGFLFSQVVQLKRG